MSTRSKTPCRRLPLAAFVGLTLVCSMYAGLAYGQTGLSDVSTINPDMQQKLMRRGSLTLRDASLIEALFAIRDNWDINIVVGNDVVGEINGAYTDAPLHEILDSILVARGYGYRPVGNSLVIMKLQDVGDIKPLFKTAIIPLDEGDPEELLGVLQFMLSPNGKAHAVPSSKSLVILDYPDRIQMIRERVEELTHAARRVREAEEDRQSGSGTSTGPSIAGPQGATDPQGPPPPVTPQIVTAYYAPQYIRAIDLQESLQQLVSEVGSITVVDAENRIVAADYPDYLARITDAVEKLDVPRTQVRISAFIYDCSIEDIARLGVNWQHGLKSNNLTGMGGAQDQFLINSITAANPQAAAVNGAMTFMSMGSNFDVTAVVNALAQSSDSKLLADPNVVVVDRESALISIVTEIPYQQLTEGLEGGTIGTTAFREAGVKMQVTPHVARDGTVSMVVTPSFSVLSGFTEEDNQPIIDRREASTTVRVANNQTLVIGGLRQKTQVHNYSGIPVLQDLWGVGDLFRHKATTVRESELVVFLTPTIVTPHTFGRPREKAAQQYSECQLNGVPWAAGCCPNHGPGPGHNVIIPNTHDSVYVEDIGVPHPAGPSQKPPGYLDESSSRREPADDRPTGQPDTARVQAAPEDRTASLRDLVFPPRASRTTNARPDNADVGPVPETAARDRVPAQPVAHRLPPRLSRLPQTDSASVPRTDAASPRPGRAAPATQRLSPGLQRAPHVTPNQPARLPLERVPEVRRPQPVRVPASSSRPQAPEAPSSIRANPSAGPKSEPAASSKQPARPAPKKVRVDVPQKQPPTRTKSSSNHPSPASPKKSRTVKSYFGL